ncbi:MAG: hypothetical protein CO073_03300 [Candidatus Komeilibacteria bacterium CG_4_9_14_0_8_um_filter_36_9]|uniref:Uncharacterized protein n=1 Tax=Candidatus Komeilibacteria bacterium CG_4_9_14_0_8_um_filter_36_9 TaxID=1974473 RepID=A0A2M8DQT3_9BACT|nr:MAG: hypothetical protein CO073_03300 [Candidatus Komeilibacteria bacterium CG_4_9_14_0_8_um_filter_36_9]
MGLFSTSIEDKLEKLYIDMFVSMGMSYSEAKQSVKQMIEESKENVKQSGEDKLPPDFVDRLLTEPRFKHKLEVGRKEGVRDEDVRWWFNMHPIERQMMMKMDEFHKTTLVVSLLQDGKEMEEALRQVEKYHPIFGDPENTKKQKGENRPLPEQLKDRINIYIEKRATNNPEQYKKDIENSSSFNALIRKEIKAGNL